MSFGIENPYGSGGFGYAQPIDLTSGVAAVQKAEIAQRLRDKEIAKQNLRQDEQWMITQMPEQVDAMRMKMAGTISKEMEGFKKLQADVMAKAKGDPNGIPLEQKMRIANEMRRINAVVGDEQTFIKQYQAMAPKYAEFRKTLKTKEDIADFDKRLSQLQGKIADPNYKATGLDLIDPMTPPEPPVLKSVNDFLEGVTGLYNRSEYRTKSDKQGTIQLIADRMKFDPNMARLVNQSYLGVESDDKQTAAEALYNSHKDLFTKQEDVKAPRELSEKEKFGGVESDVVPIEPSNAQYGTGAYKIINWGMPIKATTEVGGRKTTGDFVPVHALPNGMVEGKMKVYREQKSDEVPYNDAENSSMDIPGSRIEVTKYDSKGKPEMAKVVTKAVAEDDVTLPYSQIRSVASKLDPSMEAYYNKLNPSATARQRSQKEMNALAEKKKQETISSFGNKQNPSAPTTKPSKLTKGSLDNL